MQMNNMNIPRQGLLGNAPPGFNPMMVPPGVRPMMRPRGPVPPMFRGKSSRHAGVAYQTPIAVCTQLRKLGKYWNFIIKIPGLEYTGISSRFMENSGK